MSDTVKFEPNVPMELALVYGQGKIVESNFGNRVMFSLVGGKVMFLDLSTAQKITELGVKARQSFFLCRYKEKRGQLDQWRAWLPGRESGEQPDGTFHVPIEHEAAPSLPAPQAPPSGSNGSIKPPHHNGNGAMPNGQAQFLLSQVNNLVDVFAAAQRYAKEKHGDQVSPQAILQLLIARVQLLRGGSDVA